MRLCEADSERRVNVMHSLTAYPLHTIQRKKENKNKTSKISHTVSHTIHWHSNHFYRKRMSARKEVTCTYLHHTKPHILSLFFLSPSLSLPLSAIFSTAGNTSATPYPWGCSRTLPPAWHGTTKAKATWVHWQRPVNHPQPCWHPKLPRLDLQGHKLHINFSSCGAHLICSGKTL